MKIKFLARALRRAMRHHPDGCHAVAAPSAHRSDGGHMASSHHVAGHHHHHHRPRWLWCRRPRGCDRMRSAEAASTGPRQRLLYSDVEGILVSGGPGSCSSSRPPPDVPHGFLAVCVGREHKRFVIPTVYLNHPAFRLLLEKAREEYGFDQRGVLTMPFEVLLFERFLWLVGHGDPPPPKGLGLEELEHYYQEEYQLFMETIHVDDD